MKNDSDSSLPVRYAWWVKLHFLFSVRVLLWLVLVLQIIASVATYGIFKRHGITNQRIDSVIEQLGVMKETGNNREQQLNDVVKTNALWPSTLPTAMTKVKP